MSEHDNNSFNDESTQSMDNASGDDDKPRIDRIGQFRIESVLGSGGMGAVYRAYDESMKRAVALKVLHPSLDISVQSQQRFAREAWITGQLDHPNIIKVYSRGEEKGRHYLAMELADGGSLADIVKQAHDSVATGTDVSETTDSGYIKSMLQKFIDLARALEHIHSKGFIHRDIKPQNILIAGSEKQFKFADFGIAHAKDMTKMTKAGDFIGTVKYMSPEMLTAHRATVDYRTDIYSLGVTLYEALTLSLPFRGDSEEKFINEILSGRVIPARQRNKGISRSFETVILKATHHDPGMRYQKAAEFADDLNRLLEDRPIVARREGLLSRGIRSVRRNRRMVAVLVVTATVLAGGGWWTAQYLQEKAEEQRVNELIQAGELGTQSLTTMSDEIAQTLVALMPDSLMLDSVVSINDRQAEILGGFDGFLLSLNGLTSISDVQAGALAKFKGMAIFLEGLVSLSEAEAAALSQFSGASLSLDGLHSINAKTAEALAHTNIQGQLSLNGLTHLGVAEARALSGIKALVLYLDGLTSISAEALRALAPSVESNFRSLSLGGLEILTDSLALELSQGRWQVLELSGLERLTDQQTTMLAAMDSAWQEFHKDLKPGTRRRFEFWHMNHVRLVIDGLQEVSEGQAMTWSQSSIYLKLSDLPALNPEKALFIKEKIGKDNETLLRGNLLSAAEFLCEQSRPVEALPLYERALTTIIDERIMLAINFAGESGFDDWRHELDSLHELTIYGRLNAFELGAQIRLEQRRPTEAINLLEQAVSSIYGDRDSTLLSVEWHRLLEAAHEQATLSLLDGYIITGQLGPAESLSADLQKIVDSTYEPWDWRADSTYGLSHLKMAKLLRLQGDLHRARHRDREAGELFRRSIQILEEISNPNNPDVADVIEKYIVIETELGHVGIVDSLKKRVAEIRANPNQTPEGSSN